MIVVVEPTLQENLIILLTLLGHWYLSGVVFSIIFGIYLILRKEVEEVRVRHIETLLGLALFGPIFGVFLLAIFIYAASSRIREGYSSRRDNILWRSRSSKIKDILYGDNNDRS